MYRVEKGVEEFTDIEEEIKKVVFKFVEASSLLSNTVAVAFLLLLNRYAEDSFNRMGRQSETDRFALQLVYNGELEGSRFSHNSFRESFQRCISVVFTSNITISHNIGYNTKGHCIYVKWSSQFNMITQNLVSETYRVDRPAPNEDDDDPTSFYIRYYIQRRPLIHQ